MRADIAHPQIDQVALVLGQDFDADFRNSVDCARLPSVAPELPAQHHRSGRIDFMRLENNA